MAKFIIFTRKTSNIQMKSREYVWRYWNSLVIKLSFTIKTTEIRNVSDKKKFKSVSKSRSSDVDISKGLKMGLKIWLSKSDSLKYIMYIKNNVQKMYAEMVKKL